MTRFENDDKVSLSFRQAGLKTKLGEKMTKVEEILGRKLKRLRKNIIEYKKLEIDYKYWLWQLDVLKYVLMMLEDRKETKND